MVLTVCQAVLCTLYIIHSLNSHTVMVILMHTTFLRGGSQHTEGLGSSSRVTGEQWQSQHVRWAATGCRSSLRVHCLLWWEHLSSANCSYVSFAEHSGVRVGCQVSCM